MTLLRQFVEVADAMGVARAARNLRITQPALSKNLKRLEEIVGASLIERHSKGTELTSAGKALYKRAAKIVLEYEHAMQEVQNAMAQDEGLLRIGAGSVFASTIIPAAIPRFQKHFPRYRVSIRTLPAEDLREELNLGRVDMIASALLEEGNVDSFKRPVRRARLSILCANNHPLAQLQARSSAPLPLAAVTDYPFASFGPDHNLIKKLAHLLGEAGAPPPRYSVETSSIFGTLQLLREGQHVMFGSTLLTEFPIGAGITSLNVDADLGDYVMGFELRQGMEQIPAYRGLMNILTQEIERIK